MKEVTRMTLEQLGYELTDNIVRRCMTRLLSVRVYIRKVKQVIAREA